MSINILAMRKLGLLNVWNDNLRDGLPYPHTGRIRQPAQLRVSASRFQRLVNVGAEVLCADARGEARFVHYFFRLFIYMGEDDTDASPFALSKSSVRECIAVASMAFTLRIRRIRQVVSSRRVIRRILSAAAKNMGPEIS